VSSKSRFLQIRVTPAQKAAIKAQAERAGLDMSGYVIERLLPGSRRSFQQLAADLAAEPARRRFTVAALNDFLTAASPQEYVGATAEPPATELPPYEANYLAAMVETAAHRLGLLAPEWTQAVAPLRDDDIERLLSELNRELADVDVHGDVYLVGGAVLCLVHKVRESTLDLDARFEPAATLRSAAARIALRHDLPPSWLNDAVKGYLSDRGSFRRYLELSHLTVYTAEPEYLLAMKCLAARIGEEFHDLDDIRFLLRYLNIADAADARTVLEKYYPLERYPQKTLYLLDELFG
jgi:hypothetical protein